MPTLRHPSHRPAPRARWVVGVAVTVLVLLVAASWVGHLSSRAAAWPVVGHHRTRTDVPRQVASLPGVTVPGGPGRAATTSDLRAAARVVWPLPERCSDEHAARPGARLPVGTGYSTDPASLGPGARLQRVLGLRAGSLVALDGGGAPTDCDRLRWAVVRSAIPTQHLAHLDQIVLYDYPGSDNRPAAVRTGFFEPNPTDPARYRIALATDLSDLEQLLTIAHEVGHVTSLYPDRPTVSRDDRCPWVIDDAGTCAAADSPMTEFYARTWAPAARTAVARAYADHRQPGKDELRALYAAHPTDYVSAYAATHPTEDYAESYAYWCLWGTATTAPVEGGPRHGLAKRAFFDDAVRRGLLPAASCSVLRGIAGRG